MIKHNIVQKMLFLSIVLLFVCNCIAFEVDHDVIFKLYKRENQTVYSNLRMDASKLVSSDSFDPKLPTRIYIHGFFPKVSKIDRYRQEYLSVGDFNFIVVDWTKGASTVDYFMAKRRAYEVADKLADFLEGLIEKGLNLKNLNIIGHSLGAHIAGCAGKKLKSKEKIATIIGLDPTGVFIDFTDESKHLTASDAEYVQVIHTDIATFGTDQPMGHADIYPNGGYQPGCTTHNKLTAWFDKCSHHRSHDLFWETLKTNFTAIRCASYSEITIDRCTFTNVTTLMGGDIPANSIRPHGIFYLETKGSSPFVIADYRLFNNTEIISEFKFGIN